MSRQNSTINSFISCWRGVCGLAYYVVSRSKHYHYAEPCLRRLRFYSIPAHSLLSPPLSLQLPLFLSLPFSSPLPLSDCLSVCMPVCLVSVFTSPPPPPSFSPALSACFKALFYQSPLPPISSPFLSLSSLSSSLEVIAPKAPYTRHWAQYLKRLPSLSLPLPLAASSSVIANSSPLF